MEPSTVRKLSTTREIDPFVLATERRRRRLPAFLLAQKLRVDRTELSLFETGKRPLPDADRPGSPFTLGQAASRYMAALRAFDAFLAEPIRGEAA